MHFFRTYYLQITFCDSFRSPFDIKCLYISSAFRYLINYVILKLFFLMERLFLPKTLRHHHAYTECFLFSQYPIGPYLLFLIQFLLTPSFVLSISDWLPNRLDSIWKSCVIRSCLFCYLYTTIPFNICQPFLFFSFIFLSIFVCIQ